MSYSLVIGDVAQVRIYCTYKDQTAINIRHYVCTASEGIGIYQADLADYLVNRFAVPYQNCLTFDAKFFGVDVQRINKTPDPLPEHSTTQPVAGLTGTTPNASQICGLVTLMTRYAGRGFRGRAYIPFPDVLSCENSGRPTPDYVDALKVIGAAMIQPISIATGPDGGDFQPALYHHKDDSFTFLADYRANAKWATQRRRGAYGRVNVAPW
jgi:hypothetical protein